MVLKKIVVVFLLINIRPLLSWHNGEQAITIIWQHNRSVAWEHDWLMELLSGLKIKIIDDGTFTVYQNNSIIVVAADQEKQMVPYFQKLKDNGIKFGIILLNDENYISSTDYYEYPLFVFKNYWHKKYAPFDHVYCFMLGYKSGFWDRDTQIIKPAHQRKYTWSFAGQICRKFTEEEKKNKYHNSRIEMVKYLREIPNFFLHPIYGWNSPKSMKACDYQDIMLDSIFIPCPRGHWNLDTYRLSEALECGCIPIVETEPIDYFHNFLGDHPFICISNWSQVNQILNKLLESTADLEKRQIACQEWWTHYKRATNALFVHTIKKAFFAKTTKCKKRGL